MSADWIVVAGASKGIGLSTAELLLQKGLSVVVSARSANVLEEKFAKYGVEKVRIIPNDFADLPSIADFSSRVNAEVGPVAGLVYSAGLQYTVPLSMASPERALEIFKVNTFAAIECVRCFSKKKLAAEGASFVLISSLAAHEGAVGKTLYGASKGALEGFLPPAAAELAQRQMRLNAVSLGVINTEMSAGFINKMTEEQKIALEKSYPLGIGRPQDAANAIAWLLSKESSWVTGQVFTIDGGHMARG